MTSRVQEIRGASAKLDSLNKRINETVRTRDRGAEERERWSRACAEFHTKYAELFYPGGDASLDALKRHESGAIQLALDFLDADPHHFRSGYTKEEVWRRVRNAPLIAKDKLRLEEIAIRYLDRRISREFWAMARVCRLSPQANSGIACAAWQNPKAIRRKRERHICSCTGKVLPQAARIE